MKRENYFWGVSASLMLALSSGAYADGWRHEGWNDRDEGRYEHHHRRHDGHGYWNGRYYVTEAAPVYYYSAPQPVYYQPVYYRPAYYSPPVYRQPVYYQQPSVSFGLNLGR